MIVEPTSKMSLVSGNTQPRSQALSYDTPRGGETLVGAGHVILQILSASGGVGKVSYYMLPLSGPSFPQPPCWTTSFFCVLLGICAFKQCL